MQKPAFDPTDTDWIVNAANYLEVSEFEIFRNAFTDWYGQKAPEKQIEKVFIAYLVENKVPFWVRNYARDRVPKETSLTDEADKDARTANNMLYLASVIAEYVLLACYLMVR